MWKMIDYDFECTECGDLYAAPPTFNIPPPPVDTSKFGYRSCDADTEAFIQSQQNMLEGDVCPSILIFDEYWQTSRAIQVTAITAVFLLFLFVIILVSSLCIWKHRRKAQDSLDCKAASSTHERLEANTIASHMQYGYSAVNLDHLRPLVHHRPFANELLHINPSRTCYRPQQCLLPSSPGPDPYRSNDNVYEELDIGSHSLGSETSNESQTCVNSDDDFAEDELSIVEVNATNHSVPINQPNAAQCCTCLNTAPSSTNTAQGVANFMPRNVNAEINQSSSIPINVMQRNMVYNTTDNRKWIKKRSLQQTSRLPRPSREQASVSQLTSPRRFSKVSPVWAKEPYYIRTIAPNSLPRMPQFVDNGSMNLDTSRGRRYMFHQPALLSLDRRHRAPPTNDHVEPYYESMYHIRNTPYTIHKEAIPKSSTNEPTYSIYAQGMSTSFQNPGNRYVGAESVGSDSGYSNRTTSSVSNCQEYEVNLSSPTAAASQNRLKTAPELTSARSNNQCECTSDTPADGAQISVDCITGEQLACENLSATRSSKPNVDGTGV